MHSNLICARHEALPHRTGFSTEPSRDRHGPYLQGFSSLSRYRQCRRSRRSLARPTHRPGPVQSESGQQPSMPAGQPAEPTSAPAGVNCPPFIRKGACGHRGPSFLSSSCSGTRPPYARHAPDVPSPPPPQTRTVRTVVDIASQCLSLLVSLAHSFHRSIAHSRSFTLSQTPLRSITLSLSHTLAHSLTLSHSLALSLAHTLSLSYQLLVHRVTYIAPALGERRIDGSKRCFCAAEAGRRTSTGTTKRPTGDPPRPVPPMPPQQRRQQQWQPQPQQQQQHRQQWPQHRPQWAPRRQ